MASNPHKGDGVFGMPLVECRIRNYRAFEDTGLISIKSLFTLVGRNDTGKSTVLRALELFFNPPKRGGIAVHEAHAGNDREPAVIEVAFDPAALETTKVKLDAKHMVDIVEDGLVDEHGLLRLRLTVSTAKVEAFEIRIHDVDDDDFFPLALKKHEALLELLRARGLPATRAGKETNKEKRDALRQWAQEQGRGLRTAWVDAQGIEKAIREILPHFVYFTDESNYSIGQTAVQNQLKAVVDAAIARIPEATQIEDAMRAAIQEEFDEITKRLNAMSSDTVRLTADPTVSWRKAVDSVGLQWTDATGFSTPFEQRGAGMRRLFMVAYFQHQAAKSLQEEAGPRYVFAIEEPEVHLHPSAQRTLGQALKDVSAAGHTVLFTTHSPTFAALVPIQNLALVTRNGVKSEIIGHPLLDYALVARELGVEASDRLVGKNYVVLVEGRRDADFYTYLLTEMYASGDTQLDPDKVLFIPGGGIGTLRYWVNTRRMDEAGLKWALIMDSDRLAEGEPPGQKQQEILKSLPPSCAYAHVLKRTAIENYLEASAVRAVLRIDCQIPPYGQITDMAGSALGKRTLNKIKDHVVPIARYMGVAQLKATACDENGNCEWIELFENLRSAFGL